MTIAKPTQVATPFANSGLKNSIPQSATGSNLASLEEGFPAVTMAAVADGGTPPQGQDFNGILNQVTNQLRYSQAGGLYPYDATFCTAIGGYPLGAILMSADGSKVWQNQVSGNTNNPDYDSTNWTELCTVDALTAGLATKQGTLTFDSTPTTNSSNPVTSDGVKTALDGKLSLTGGEMAGAILSSANVGVEVSRDSEGTWGCSAIRTDTGNNIAFGIGGSGDNRGIFDNSLNNWLINRNSTGALQSGGADVILSTGGTMTGYLKFNKSDVFVLNKDDKAVLGHDANNNQTYLSSPDGGTYLRAGNDKSLKWSGINMSAMSLPSGTTTAFTLPASQGTYIAPADGWIGIRKKATAVGQYLRVNVNGVLMRMAAVTATEDIEMTFPVKKGASVFFVYNLGGATSICNFVYAEGAVLEA